MFLHEVVESFTDDPSSKTAFQLARHLAEYPHLVRDVSPHARGRAVAYLTESKDTKHQRFATYLTD